MVRTSTDRIAELEQKIAAIKARDERKAARAKPETKHLITALRGIDGALKESTDAELRVPLDEARGLVSGALGLLGVQPKAGKVRGPGAAVKGRRKRAGQQA
jgi:hypothetical protein